MPKSHRQDRPDRPSQKGRKGASGTAETLLKQRVKAERQSVYRQAVNEAAERVFAEKGADRSRMREIAAEAGISLGTLYGVVDGKESLFFGIHRNRMRQFLDCIRAAHEAHEETLASHLAVLRLGGQFFLDHPDFLRICCRDGFGWASRRPAAGSGIDLWVEGSAIPRDLFARGIAEGIYVDEDPDLLLLKMLALKQADLTHWVNQGMKTPHEVVLDRLENQFVRAFCVHAS
jgi:AcrR family transcriptional regulator